MKNFLVKVFFGTIGIVMAYKLADHAIASHEAIRYNERAVEYVKAVADLAKATNGEVSGSLPNFATATFEDRNAKR